MVFASKEQNRMNLVDLIPESLMLLDLKARDKKGVIRELLNHLVQEKKLSEESARKAEKNIHKRESQGSTGIGKGLAIPHSKSCSFIDGVLAVFGRSAEGISFDSVDGEPVKVIFLIISSDEYAEDHLGVIKKVAMLHRDEKTLRFLATTKNAQGIAEVFKEIDEGQL